MECIDIDFGCFHYGCQPQTQHFLKYINNTSTSMYKADLNHPCHCRDTNIYRRNVLKIFAPVDGWSKGIVNWGYDSLIRYLWTPTHRRHKCLYLNVDNAHSTINKNNQSLYQDIPYNLVKNSSETQIIVTQAYTILILVCNCTRICM